MKTRILVPAVLVALLVAAIALWPSFVASRVAISRAHAYPTIAPVTRDDLERPQYIAFWEKATKENHPGDYLSPQHLASQYLMRYREHGDIQDVYRAQAMAERSLRVQPRHNVAAESTLASVALTFHRFHEALAITRHIESYDVGDEQQMIREASLDLEIGDYAAADRVVAKLPPAPEADLARDVLLTRIDELEGRLASARERLVRPTALENSQFEAPVTERAWYYFRSGEIAFEAGANDEAIADEAQALAIFPNDVDASRAKARFECALHRWSDCLADATFSANIIPYPETLGYEADAQAALGDDAAAARTRDLIRTVERVGNAERISDRLLAVYYADHHLYPDDAYRIAKRELAVRDDLFTEDTLAWAAAQDGKWDEARTHILNALRFDTENSLIQYHAGVIAEHFGDRAEAKKRLERALALNPQFHPTFADDARTRLASL